VKLPWFSVDLSPEENEHPALSITRRRLDAAAPPLGVEGPNVGQLPQYSFYASVLIFPTDGCWEISAKRKQSRLRFVVWID
jgi:hypothetical protein